jgi:cytochrome c5
MTPHDDRTFIRHFSWVLAVLIAITIFFIFLSFLIAGKAGVDARSGYTYVQYMQAHAASAAAAPTSNGRLASAAGTIGTTAVTTGGAKPNGAAVWQAHCSVCHATGVAGAPKIGDVKAWTSILAGTDKATLYRHAIDGFKGKHGYMPPKGGASSLTAVEVKAAVDYMVGKSGG